MAEWLADNRAVFALITIIGLLIAFGWSIQVGVRQTRLRARDEVFGDPERTKGGWYWAVCGVSALMLVWFYYSWGTARAVFPNAANELCQVAKVNESMAPISAALPVRSRYLKSTTLVVRNGAQLDALARSMPEGVFSPREAALLETGISQTRQLIALLSDPTYTPRETRDALAGVEGRLGELAARLDAGPGDMQPGADALSQPRWGTSEVEIPLLPMTPRGVLFDYVSTELVAVSEDFLSIRNLSPEAEALIESTGGLINGIKKADPEVSLDEDGEKDRKAYIKAVERIFKRIDDATIFPAEEMASISAFSVGRSRDAFCEIIKSLNRAEVSTLANKEMELHAAEAGAHTAVSFCAVHVHDEALMRVRILRHQDKNQHLHHEEKDQREDRFLDGEGKHRNTGNNQERK